MSTATSITTFLAPTIQGAAGLRWGMSRSEVWNALPKTLREQLAPVGPRFFTTAVVLLADEPFYIGYRFSSGLVGINLAGGGGFPDLPGALSLKIGNPTRGPRRDGHTTTHEWDLSASVSVALFSNPPHNGTPGNISILCGLQGPAIRPSPRPATPHPELEELLDFASIVRDRDAGFHRAASEAFADYRVAVGMCPQCGTVADLSHSPDCAHATSCKACVNCGRRAGIIPFDGKAFCLLCAPVRVLARYPNASAPRLCLIRDPDSSSAQPTHWTPPDADDVALPLARTAARTARRLKRAVIAFGAVAVILWLVRARWPAAVAAALGLVTAFFFRRQNRRYSVLWSCITGARRGFRPAHPKAGDLLSLDPRPYWFGPSLLGRVVHAADREGVAIIARDPLETEGLCFSYGRWFVVRLGDSVRFDYFNDSPTVVSREDNHL